MSRWIEEYNQLKEKINSVQELLKKINCNGNKECIRLKRVFNNLYKLINNLDPELISYKDYCNLLYSGNKNIGYTTINCQNFLSKLYEFIENEELENANNILDEINKILKPYILHKKRLGEPLAESVEIYMKELEKHLKELKEIEIEEQSLREIIEKIYEYNNELFEDNEESSSIKSKIESLMNEIERQKNKIDEFYNNLFIDYENEASIQSSINEFLSEIKKIKQESESLKEEIEKILLNSRNTIKDLKKFYVEIFGEESEETGELKGGLKKELEIRKNELDKLKQDYEKFENEQKEKIKVLYNEIEKHLPGAVSSGLASAYAEKREKFEKEVEKWNKIFISSIIFMMIGSLFLFWFDIGKMNNFSDIINKLLKYSPFYIPAIWFSLYAGKRANENMRLEQEYAHKEALAKSYISHKIQIEELGSEKKEELLERLLENSIKTFSLNPSYVLDKNNEIEHPIFKLLNFGKKNNKTSKIQQEENINNIQKEN